MTRAEQVQAPVRQSKPVELVWHEEVNPGRLTRVAEILADILDNESTPEERPK